MTIRAIPSFLLASLLMTTVGYGQLRLPAVISDHAMVQAGKSVAIWGWAAPGAQVTVKFTGGDPGETFTATADGTGKWTGTLPALKSGTAGTLAVSTDKGETKTVKDVLAGEVWLCGGQSNMEYDIEGTGRVFTKDPAEVAEVAQNVATAKTEADGAQPPIRYFGVKATRSNTALDDVKGQWVLATSANVARISAVAWNFGIALQNKTHLPIGLVVSCVGNTPVEVWMSRPTLESTSVGATVLARAKVEEDAMTPEKTAKYDADMAAWKTANPTPQLQSQNRATRPQGPPNPAAGNYVPNQYYNGMIYGLEPYTLRGVIWFQGAGNFRHPLEYGELFGAMIKEWRSEFKDEQMPFYFVEECNWGAKQVKPVEFNGVSLIREQEHQELQLPMVDMADAFDLGNSNPHFPKKKPLGERLANLAMRDCYGQPGPVNSPMFKSFAVEGNKIRLTFTHAEGLRVRDGGDVKGFAIRGATGDWVWAKGQIDGQDILVWSDEVPTPTSVRYAWAINPTTSIENGAGLPLSGFRTDSDSQDPLP
jgi:sialate O-acetylesterase